MKSADKGPTAGELDCLNVLWNAEANGGGPMKLSEIRQAIIRRRRELSEPEPALSTVSTYLRSAAAKGLLEEVRVGKDGSTYSKPKKSGRGALARTRSPQTGYRAAVAPRNVFHDTILAIAEAYPDGRRLELLVDVASSLDVPKQVLSQIESWVNRRSNR